MPGSDERMWCVSLDPTAHRVCPALSSANHWATDFSRLLSRSESLNTSMASNSVLQMSFFFPAPAFTSNADWVK